MGGLDDERWVEVSPSQFPHEAEGLAYARQLIPNQAPFRAWSNFEFRDKHGRWHEVDLLVLGRRRLHLVELKHYWGTLRGDDHVWQRNNARAQPSPLKLARRKAQYLASLLSDEFETWKREKKAYGAPPTREVVPLIQESVFLHHRDFVSELTQQRAINLFGFDGATSRTHLPGISSLLLEPAEPGRQIHERILAELMRRIGLVQRREREVGSWVITGEPVGDGEGWQEWEAFHRVDQERHGRIRFAVAPPGSGQDEHRRLRTVVTHEYAVLRRLHHDAVLQPDDLIESDLGVGLVYPVAQDWQRLDLWLAERRQGLPIETVLHLLRQVAEAVQYAHGNKVVHRGLSPYAIWVKPGQRGSYAVQVRDWQAAGLIDANRTRDATGPAGVTALLGAGGPGVTNDDDVWLQAFAAPEGAMAAGADRVRVDVFGLGALACYLLTGKPPASGRSAQSARLRDQSGYDLAADLPQVSSALRDAVLDATRPAVSQRTVDVAGFLASLSLEERRDTEHDTVLDPLDALPGAVLDGRFELRLRLGQGSTAVGLLVHDRERPGPDVVLKVAVDDTAAARLRDEAEILSSLDSPRIVSLIGAPIQVGGRCALVLDSAGPHTLAHELRPGSRLALDLLERWGIDLLEALTALDQAGVDHRDIKPANLGVSLGNKQARRLVLFDFSLSRAAASAVHAGTEAYLDPFLGTRGRERFDSAAEMWSAAVVLFEMATGGLPRFGDGQSAAATIPDNAHVVPDQFDPSVATGLVAFFRKALAREASQRFDTANDMLAAWRTVLSESRTSAPDDALERRERAQSDTSLADAGLSARALSALEPLGVSTVGELVAVDPNALRRINGAATKKEVGEAAALWRPRFASRRRAAAVAPDGDWPEPYEAADLLLAPVRGGRTPVRPEIVASVLGIQGDVDAFATQAQIGATLADPVSNARVNQALGESQAAWAGDDRARELLDGAFAASRAQLTDLGGVAVVDELVTGLTTRMAPLAEPGSGERRIVTGLLRLALDRQRSLSRDGTVDGAEVVIRRRGGRPPVVAKSTELLDLADTLATAADRLVEQRSEPVIAADRVRETLIPLTSGLQVDPQLIDGTRLVTLAAGLSTRSAATSLGELHSRDLGQLTALTQTFGTFGSGLELRDTEMRERVRVRFPAVPELPDRTRLVDLVRESGLPLTWDSSKHVFRSGTTSSDTTGLVSRAATEHLASAPVAARGVVGQRLADSIGRRSFVALGVDAQQLDRLVDVLEADYGARSINLTAGLLDALQDEAGRAGLSWSTVLEADAQPAHTTAARGLSLLVDRAMAVVESRVDERLTEPGDAPVLLLDPAPLARYDLLGRLGRWTDLASGRGRAVWLLLPQLFASRGAVVDGKPLPLASPGQYVPVDGQWIGSRVESLRADRLTPTLAEPGQPAPPPPTGRTR